MHRIRQLGEQQLPLREFDTASFNWGGKDDAYSIHEAATVLEGLRLLELSLPAVVF